MLKVTVIIPCYNREDFIRETIDSALDQTFRNIEVVAVDDGSTDGTRTILESYNGRVKIMEHPGRANRGQSAAINLAMRSTGGEYVAILDSDDVWAPKKIEQQVAFLERNPSIGLVYSNGYAIDERGRRLYELYSKDHHEENKPERVLLECHFGCPSSYLVHRSAYERAGEYDETLRSSQDHDMAVRLAEVTNVAYLDEPLWYYRRHTNTLSRKHASRRWKNGFYILSKACKRHKYGLNVRRQRLAVLHFRLGQCMVEEKRYFAGAGRFLLAGLLDPLRGMGVLFGKESMGGPH